MNSKRIVTLIQLRKQKTPTLVMRNLLIFTKEWLYMSISKSVRVRVHSVTDGNAGTEQTAQVYSFTKLSYKNKRPIVPF